MIPAAAVLIGAAAAFATPSAQAATASKPPAAPKTVVLSVPPRASKYIPAEMDYWLVKGVDDIYRTHWDEAEASARKAIEMNPEHPHAYMGLAGVAWTKFVFGTDQGEPKLLDLFDTRLNDTVRVATKWVKAHPDDPAGLMTLGSTYGLASRLALIRRQWVRGYLLGRKAVSITRQSVQKDPEFWDGYLGLGMYDYYTDALPRVVGVLAKLVLRGNRQRGIETLKMVAEKGHYSRSNAKVLLVEIYTEDQWGAKDPQKALALMKEMRAMFPESPMMNSAWFVALYEAQRFSEAVDAARDYMARVAEGEYPPLEAGKGGVGLGVSLWRVGKVDEARAALAQAQTVMQNGRLSRWAVWSHVRAGQLEDSLGRRDEAVKHYKLAAAEPDTWELRQYAKAGLKSPFPRGGKPGPIPPPD